MVKKSLPLRKGDAFIPDSTFYSKDLYVVEDVYYASPDIIYWARHVKSRRARFLLSSRVFNKSEHYQKLTNAALINLVRKNDRRAIIEFVKRFKHYPKFIHK